MFDKIFAIDHFPPDLLIPVLNLRISSFPTFLNEEIILKNIYMFAYFIYISEVLLSD